MGATPPAPKSQRRTAPRRRAALNAAQRPPVAPAERVGVVHLTAEYWPFARTGGLGEAVSGLATTQATAGHPTTVVMPLYQLVHETTSSLERTGSALTVTLGGDIERAWLYRTPPRDAAGPHVFFIEHPDFFDRAGIYGDNGADYPDNARRFAFFCLAALTALPEIAPEAQLLHAHDWHTALAPVYLRTAFAGQPFHGRLASVLSVHNAGFQGHFPPETMADLSLPAELYNADVFEWYGRMNALKGGMAHSDVVVTVSPSHAEELRPAEGGFGLHDRFTGLGDRLVGILNGIDPDLWNPETDPELTGNYSSEDLAGKRRCKAALQRAYGLAQRGHTPLFGMSARMVAQKGLDLVLGADLLGTTDAQFIFLGAGTRATRATNGTSSFTRSAGRAASSSGASAARTWTWAGNARTSRRSRTSGRWGMPPISFISSRASRSSRPTGEGAASSWRRSIPSCSDTGGSRGRTSWPRRTAPCAVPARTASAR